MPAPSPIEQACRHCGLGRRVDGTMVEAFPGIVCPGHEFHFHQPTPPSPRYAESVFILCDGDRGGRRPRGTCFAISTNHLLTADHNLNPHRAQKYYHIARNIVRGRDGSLNFPGGIHLVRVYCYNQEKDYAILQVVEPCPPLERIPISIDPIQPDTDLKVFHFPIGVFIDGESSGISLFTKWVKSSSPLGHHLLCDGGLFSGSSGAPLITRDGNVVSFHTESIREASELPNFDASDSVVDALSIHSASIATNANVHNSVMNSLIIGACPHLVETLRDLGIIP